MNFRYWLFLIIGLLAGGAIGWFSYPHQGLEFFRLIKGEVFGGLFTAASLLLSLKTYIIVKLQESIYSKESYQKTFARMREEGKIGYDDHLTPLRKLSAGLSLAVVICSLAAIMQIIASALQNQVGLVIAWSFSLCALCVLTNCLFLIRDNLKRYFEQLKADAKADIEKHRGAYRDSINNPPTMDSVDDSI